MTIQNKKLSDFCTEESLRFDVKYISSFEVNNNDFYNYKDLFDFVKYERIDTSSFKVFRYAEIGNVNKLGGVEPVELSFNNRQEEYDSLLKKIEEKNDIIEPICGDILIAKTRPYLNKNVLIDNEKIYFTKAFIHIRPQINSKLFYLLLRNKFINKINAVSRQGKGYPTIKEDDLKTIRFPKSMIDTLIKVQDVLLKKIELLQIDMDSLKKSKQKTVDIINQVFGEELEFDWKEFEERKKKKFYNSNLLDFSNNIDCRIGVRFHNKAGEYLQSFLKGKTPKRIKDFIKENIVLGSSVSPSDYDKDGNYYYVAMSNIKTWAFDSEESKKVNSVYVKNNIAKSIQKDDILLARSGEGTIGKVALIENKNVCGIFSDFTQRVRLKDFNPLCAYYYFRSDFFQYLVYTHKKGLGNNTNIFPSQIQEFPMPDWNKEKQTEIVNKIKNQLDEQQDIDNKINQKQQEINELIEKEIST